MKTEIKKTLKSGFVLNEQELRRLASTIRDQLKSAYPDAETKQSFLVKFRNGSISEPTSIDEIIDQENVGSEAIVELTLREIVTQDPGCSVEITFADGGKEDSKDKAISYSITHNDKDWVFVTNSKLDERLSRIKKISWGRLAADKSFTSIISLIAMLVFISVAFSYSLPDAAAHRVGVENLVHQYKGDKNFAVIEFTGKLELLRTQNTGDIGFLRYFPYYMAGLFLITLSFGLLASRVTEYLFPSYNFLWGDYVDHYQRRRTISYVIFVVIILSIVISVLANFISGRLLHLG